MSRASKDFREQGTKPEVEGYSYNSVEFHPKIQWFEFKACGDIVTVNLDEQRVILAIRETAKENTEKLADEWMENPQALSLPLIPTGRLLVKILLYVKRPASHFHSLVKTETTPRLKDDAPDVSDDLTVNTSQIVRVITQALVGVACDAVEQIINVQVTSRWGKYDSDRCHRDLRGESGAFKVDVCPWNQSAARQNHNHWS